MVILTHAEFQTNKMTYKTSVKKVGEISRESPPCFDLVKLPWKYYE